LSWGPFAKANDDERRGRLWNVSPAAGVASHGQAVEKYAKVQIVGEFYVTLGRLGADPSLLAIVRSRPDILVEDAEVHSLLRQCNAAGKAMRGESPEGRRSTGRHPASVPLPR
jgi:hypothetical protein